MNNKLFTSISIQEQENTSGGANVPAILTVPDGSNIPIIPPTSQPIRIDGIPLSDLLKQILPVLGYSLTIPTSFGF